MNPDCHRHLPSPYRRKEQEMATDEHVETLIIGGGQAGLAVGYHLKSRKRDFLILDANERVGDSWRMRWPSLRLYSPASFDGLPGMAFPAPRSLVSDRCRDGRLSRVVRKAVRATRPIRDHGRALREEWRRIHRDSPAIVIYGADNVVVATGVFQHERPIIPEFAAELDPAIRQLHSADYHGPEQLQPGRCSWSARRTREATSRSRLRAPGTRPCSPEGIPARSRSDIESRLDAVHGHVLQASCGRGS